MNVFCGDLLVHLNCLLHDRLKAEEQEQHLAQNCRFVLYNVASLLRNHMFKFLMTLNVEQIWDSGTGQLKLTLTGQIEQVQGIYKGFLSYLEISDIFVLLLLFKSHHESE